MVSAILNTVNVFYLNPVLITKKIHIKTEKKNKNINPKGLNRRGR